MAISHHSTRPLFSKAAHRFITNILQWFVASEVAYDENRPGVRNLEFGLLAWGRAAAELGAVWSVPSNDSSTISTALPRRPTFCWTITPLFLSLQTISAAALTSIATRCTHIRLCAGLRPRRHERHCRPWLGTGSETSASVRTGASASRQRRQRLLNGHTRSSTGYRRPVAHDFSTGVLGSPIPRGG